MATLPFDCDSDVCNRGEEGAFAHSDVALIKIWDIVIAVDFVNTFETAFFDHGQSTTWTFFSWLEKDADELVCWDLGSVVDQYLDCAKGSDHVSVMATHMCPIGSRPIFKMWIVFRNGQAIHVGAYRNCLGSVILNLGSFSPDIHNKSSACTFLDFNILQPHPFERLDQ